MNFCCILALLQQELRTFLPKVDYCMVVRALDMRELGLNRFRQRMGLNLIVLLMRLLHKMGRSVPFPAMFHVKIQAAVAFLMTSDPSGVCCISVWG